MVTVQNNQKQGGRNGRSSRKNTIALWLLTLAVFAIGTAELLPMGLLLPIASETGVTIPAAGMLVTGYALGVVFGGPVLSAMTGRLSRKMVMGSFLGLFMIGGLLCTFAPSYTVLFAGRIISSLAQGTLYGIIVVTAKDLAQPGKEGSNIAMVGTGLTLAVILGAPLGTLLGEWLGWRMPFLAVTLLSLATLLGMLKWIPDLPRAQGVSLSKQLRTVSSPAFVLVLLMTVFGAGGTFAAFTYITPILKHISGFSGGSISLILLVFGLGSVIGNLLGGRLADRRLLPALFGGMALLAASMAIFSWTSHGQTAAIVTVFIWGVAAYSIIAPLNMRVLQKAGDAQELASTLNISAFNMGNAIGAFVGGMVIDSPLGLPAVPWTASLVTLIGLLLTIWSMSLDRRAVRPVQCSESCPAAQSSAC
ncbi:MFS transporter [Paenibacillus caui]|uniref:MFS transporter n=1 Tax=Paenibacillus caui TaxID=2873927 RepID=UPI001CA7F7B7|nr:MFS transporter [Paenibacillus caui]